MSTKKWKMLDKNKTQNLKPKIEDVIRILLHNRNISTKKETEEFLDGKISSVTPKSVGINQVEIKKSLDRIKKAIENKEQIVIFGDYDVDGITGTAILWETLFALSDKVTPYIPSRLEEGYGLSITGIENCKLKIMDSTLLNKLKQIVKCDVVTDDKTLSQ